MRNKSFYKYTKINNNGPSIVPWGTPDGTVFSPDTVIDNSALLRFDVITLLHLLK